MIIKLPTFQPRDYQRDLLEAFFYKGYKKLYLMQHRRAGKDLSCWNLIIGAACERVGLYLYLLPQTNQARKVIWNGMDGSGKRFLDYLPADLIERINNQEMSLRLINGSILQLTGSNNYNALMGSNPVGIVYSEYALQDPRARQYLSPILTENGGWEIINTTPRGKNHAHKVYQQALGSPTEWFVQRLTIEDTKKADGAPVITKEDVEIERRGGMSDELIRQEFYCSFDVGIVGSYYTQEMDRAEAEGRVTVFEVNKNLPVYTSWDLGISDATAIWWFQPNGPNIDVIYYYENNNFGIEHYIQKIEDVKDMFKFRYADHFAPHDISKRDLMTPQTRQMIAASKGIHFNRVPQTSDVDKDIQCVKTMFPKFRFHMEHCRQGLDCLREYRRKYDEVNKVFMQKPLHDWSSNCFTGDTQVLTRYGTSQIMHLPMEGEILTLCGWKRYINPRITRKNAQLVRVAFTDGTTVKCTPDHMFLTVSGWKSAESLTNGLEIQSSLLEPTDTSKNTVITIAKRLIIDSVEKIQEVEDVWCMTVPAIEHFSLSNGAVVHNCADSFRTFCMAWQDLYTRPAHMNQPFKYQMPQPNQNSFQKQRTSVNNL